MRDFKETNEKGKESTSTTLLAKLQWDPGVKFNGDIAGALKGEYWLASGKVSFVSVAYRGEEVYDFTGQVDTIIKRSVQRLVLLVPVDDTK